MTGLDDGDDNAAGFDCLVRARAGSSNSRWVVINVLQWPQLAAMAIQAHQSPKFVKIVLLTGLVVFAAMILLTSRLRSRAAMWIWTVLIVLGLLQACRRIVVNGELDPFGQPLWEFVLFTAANLVSLYLLFTPAAQAWIRRRTAPDARLISG